MKTRQFVLWLNGYLDACDNSLNELQTEKIKNKLNDLFHHEAETINKPSLEELGEKYDFKVKTDLTTEEFNHNMNLPGEELIRC